MKHQDSVNRSIVKTISYRVVIIIATYIVSFLLTRDIALSLGITSVSSVVNTILYFGHERVWNTIKWGRVK